MEKLNTKIKTKEKVNFQELIKYIYDNDIDEDISDSEKLKRVDIVLEIYRRTKDETDIKKIKENIIELEKEVKEKRENGEI